MRGLMVVRRFAAAAEATQSATVSDVLKFSLSTPTSAIHNNITIKSVAIPAQTGAMVILSKHIPTIAQLRPGVVTVTKEDGAETEKFFVSGGFAFIHPDNTCSVNAVEAIPLADLDADLARAGLAKYEALARDGANEEEKALGQIGVSVHSAMIHALQ